MVPTIGPSNVHGQGVAAVAALATAARARAAARQAATAGGAARASHGILLVFTELYAAGPPRSVTSDGARRLRREGGGIRRRDTGGPEEAAHLRVHPLEAPAVEESVENSFPISAGSTPIAFRMSAAVDFLFRSTVAASQ